MIEVYTDGGCRKNGSKDAVCGWAYTLRFKDLYKEDSGACIGETSNRMELTAIINALNAIKRKDYKTCVYSDSAYCVNGCTSWLPNWVKEDFKDIKNDDLWRQIYDLINSFDDLSFIKVEGHSDNEKNNYVDQLVNEAMDALES